MTKQGLRITGATGEAKLKVKGDDDVCLAELRSCPVVIQWSSNGHLVVLGWSSDGPPVVLLLSNGHSVVIHCPSSGNPIVIQWLSCGHPMVIP